MSEIKKTAVVLFNLGGPARQEDVQPFLYNLFSDPAIIRAPAFVRIPLAKFISRRRAPTAMEIYELIGGGSPLLPETQKQAKALEGALQDTSLGDVRVFITMRYWHPMADDVAREVKDFAPDQIVLMPLYPQYSTTTTQSSFEDWDRAAVAAGVDVPTKRCCCYWDHKQFVRAHVRMIAPIFEEARGRGPVRLLFSAHGLPEKISRDGDPYEKQVYLSAAEILNGLRTESGDTAIDHLVCFQSRVGPLKWIGPSTDEAIHQAAREGLGVIIVPIAFVSEHSETLVELDIEYREMAEDRGITHYVRVPALGAHEDYIGALKSLVLDTSASDDDVYRGGSQGCGAENHNCPCRTE